MSFILDGVIGEFFALSSAGFQHPFATTSSSSVNSTLSANDGVANETAYSGTEKPWYAPVLQPFIAMFFFSTIRMYLPISLSKIMQPKFIVT